MESGFLWKRTARLLPSTPLVRNILILVSWIASLSLISPVYAHEAGAPFSGAIIDPLITHHAHLEDEQRVNVFFIKGSQDENGRKRFAFANELELAWAHEFTIGSEIFIPFSNASRDGDYSIGDIEVQPLKCWNRGSCSIRHLATGISEPT